MYINLEHCTSGNALKSFLFCLSWIAFDLLEKCCINEVLLLDWSPGLENIKFTRLANHICNRWAHENVGMLQRAYSRPENVVKSWSNSPWIYCSGRCVGGYLCGQTGAMTDEENMMIWVRLSNNGTDKRLDVRAVPTACWRIWEELEISVLRGHCSSGGGAGHPVIRRSLVWVPGYVSKYPWARYWTLHCTAASVISELMWQVLQSTFSCTLCSTYLFSSIPQYFILVFYFIYPIILF